MKKLLFFSLTTIYYLLSTNAVLAGNNLTITCPSASSTCTLSSPLPLIDEKNIYPGYILNPPQTLTVTNQDSTDLCNLILNSSDFLGSSLLADRVVINLNDSVQTYYSGNLNSFLSTPNINLGVVAANSSKNFYWTISFDQEAGNEYQNLSNKFNLNFNFSCGSIPTSTPAPNTGGDGGTGGGSNPGPPVCNDSFPSAPTGFYARRNVGGASATLFWAQSTSPHTHYLIAFGVQPGVYLYGDPDVGNVTNYTVRGLTPGAQYCFYVRTINGCMPGEKTAEYCINRGGPIIPPTAPPAGFEPGVLGTQTDTTPTPVPTEGEIKGTVEGTNTGCSRYWLPILYLIALLINTLYLYDQGSRREEDRSNLRYFIPFILPAVAFFIDAFFLRSRCCLIIPVYCQYFWIGNILSLLIPVAYYNKIKTKNQSFLSTFTFTLVPLPFFIYTDIVFRSLSLLFIPQEKNNHKALLLQPSFLGIFIALYLLNQSLIRSLTILKPGILGYSSEITTQKVLTQTNSQRANLGLPPLKYNAVLSQSAQQKAQDMFANNYWSHDSPQGKTPWSFFKAVGYKYLVAGENLAKDFYDTDSMLEAWMKSPTHRANIISDKYQEIGIGVVNGILGGVKTTLVVQHFATPLNGKVADNPTPTAPVVSPLIVSNEVQNPKVLAQTNPVISPLTITKIIGTLMFLIIIGVLFVDAYVTLKNQTHRLAGSATGHIGFLAIILLLILFTRQGTIFQFLQAKIWSQRRHNFA